MTTATHVSDLITDACELIERCAERRLTAAEQAEAALLCEELRVAATWDAHGEEADACTGAAEEITDLLAACAIGEPVDAPAA